MEDKDCGVCHEHSGHTAKITRIEWCIYALLLVCSFAYQQNSNKFEKLTESIATLNRTFISTARGHEGDVAISETRTDFLRSFCCGELTLLNEVIKNE